MDPEGFRLGAQGEGSAGKEGQLPLVFSPQGQGASLPLGEGRKDLSPVVVHELPGRSGEGGLLLFSLQQEGEGGGTLRALSLDRRPEAQPVAFGGLFGEQAQLGSHPVSSLPGEGPVEVPLPLVPLGQGAGLLGVLSVEAGAVGEVVELPRGEEALERVKKGASLESGLSSSLQERLGAESPSLGGEVPPPFCGVGGEEGGGGADEAPHTREDS